MGRAGRVEAGADGLAEQRLGRWRRSRSSSSAHPASSRARSCGQMITFARSIVQALRDGTRWRRVTQRRRDTRPSPKSARRCAGSARGSPAPTGARWTASGPIRPSSSTALTEAGFLSVLIPEEYGGSGLGLARRRGGAGGDPPLGRQRRRLPRPDVHHGHGAAARQPGAEAGLSAEDRLRRTAPAGLRRHRAGRRHRHHADHHLRAARRRQLRRQRPEALDQPGRALRPDGAALPHHAARARPPSPPTA